MAWLAALQVQNLAKTILCWEEPVAEWTGAQGNAAFLTTRDFREGILLEIVGQIKWQRRQGFHEQQQELNKIIASVVKAWISEEEKRLEEIHANQSESESLEEDAKAAEPEPPPQPPEPLQPQQSLPAQPLALLSPPEEVGGDEHGEVMVSKNMVVKIGGVMACDGRRGMIIKSMQRWTTRKICFCSRRTSSSHNNLVLRPQTRGHPQCQQILMRATASGRPAGMIFRFLFWEAKQHQGRLRLENSNDGRSERSRAGWKRLGARRRWHSLVLQHHRGLGARYTWSAPNPSAANTYVYAKEGDLLRASRSRKGTYYFQVLDYSSSSAKTGLLVER